ncbi:trypsin-1-like isoform X1 [Macrobrachium rosenbergii]|uniref:trypsin-1-like isoform X1 n=1 Tax=Macrobrachium rosenbergii TaxID=79674 RepID=UPI0034D44C38
MLWYKLSVIFGLCASLQAGFPSEHPSSPSYDFTGIVGGNETYKGQFPYQVSFQERLLGVFVHFCGGVIISPNFVVTAAHCVLGADYTSPQGLRVVAGEYDLNHADGDEQKVHINFIIQHPFFDEITLENDIALLRLETPLVFNEYVAALELPEQEQDFTSEMCVVTGWGSTHEGGGVSHIMRYTEIPVISDQHCRDFYILDEIFDSMVCAGYDEGHKGSCKGDSGGPLACGSYLTGLVSWAYGCARPNLPSVFTEVPHFVDWIRSHL